MATAVLKHLAVSESLWQHALVVDMLCYPYTQSFHHCVGQMEQPLDVKFDQHNICLSSDLVQSLIMSFGST